MAITATLAQTSGDTKTAIANQPTVFYVTISNSGASDVQLTGLTTTVTAPGAITTGAQGAVAPQTTVTVAASGSLSVPVTVIYPQPVTAGITAIPKEYFPTFVTVSTSDGSVVATNVLNVFVQTPKPGAGFVTPSNPWAQGTFDFEFPQNSALYPFFF